MKADICSGAERCSLEVNCMPFVCHVPVDYESICYHYLTCTHALWLMPKRRGRVGRLREKSGWASKIYKTLIILHTRAIFSHCLHRRHRSTIGPGRFLDHRNTFRERRTHYDRLFQRRDGNGRSLKREALDEPASECSRKKQMIFKPGSLLVEAKNKCLGKRAIHYRSLVRALRIVVTMELGC